MNHEPMIVSVILNYKSYKDTLECVSSIRKQSYKNKSIIIVENGSGNESWDVLSKSYASCDDVILIKNEVNLGFAKGNNVGIRYAREKLNADYVFVVNSDVVVYPGLFEAVVENDFKGIGAISPNVYRLDGTIQSPSVNTDDINIFIHKAVKQLYVKTVISAPIICRIYTLYRRLFKKNKMNSWDPNAPRGKYILQGCSYFLTPEFFKYYKCLFPGTFLYWEEIDLMYMLKQAGLTSILIDKGELLHKEKASTRELLTTNMERRRWKYSRESYRASKPLFQMDMEEIKEKYEI